MQHVFNTEHNFSHFSLWLQYGGRFVRREWKPPHVWEHRNAKLWQEVVSERDSQDETKSADLDTHLLGFGCVTKGVGDHFRVLEEREEKAVQDIRQDVETMVNQDEILNETEPGHGLMLLKHDNSCVVGLKITITRDQGDSQLGFTKRRVELSNETYTLALGNNDILNYKASHTSLFSCNASRNKLVWSFGEQGLLPGKHRYWHQVEKKGRFYISKSHLPEIINKQQVESRKRELGSDAPIATKGKSPLDQLVDSLEPPSHVLKTIELARDRFRKSLQLKSKRELILLLAPWKKNPGEPDHLLNGPTSDVIRLRNHLMLLPIEEILAQFDCLKTDIVI